MCAFPKSEGNLLSRIPRQGQEIAIGLVLVVTLFPILLKYCFPAPTLKPVVTAWKMAESILVYGMFSVMVVSGALSFLGCSMKKYFGLDQRPIGKLVQSGLLWGVGAFLGVQLLGLLVSSLAKVFGITMPLQETFTCLFKGNSPIISQWLLVFSVVVVVPFYEEMLFRGILFPGLLSLFSAPEKMKSLTGKNALRVCWATSCFSLPMILSGLFFAGIHCHLLLIPQLFLFHIFLSWVYWTTGSLLPSMIMHGLFNGMNLLLFTLFYTSAS